MFFFSIIFFSLFHNNHRHHHHYHYHQRHDLSYSLLFSLSPTTYNTIIILSLLSFPLLHNYLFFVLLPLIIIIPTTITITIIVYNTILFNLPLDLFPTRRHKTEEHIINNNLLTLLLFLLLKKKLIVFVK